MIKILHTARVRGHLVQGLVLFRLLLRLRRPPHPHLPQTQLLPIHLFLRLQYPTPTNGHTFVARATAPILKQTMSGGATNHVVTLQEFAVVTHHVKTHV